MQSLFEELKMYENLWDTEPLKEEKEFRSEFARLCSTPEGREKLKAMSAEEQKALYDADVETDPVQKILDKTPDFEIEYPGYSDESVEDHFDPGSWHGHYQSSKTVYIDDATVTVDPAEMLDALMDNIIPKYIDKVENSALLDTYRKLEKAWENSTDDTFDKAAEAWDLFVAENLEEFFNIFYNQISDHFEHRAR